MNPPQVLPGKAVFWLRNLTSYPGIHFFHFLHHTTNDCMVEAFSDHLLWLYIPFFIPIKTRMPQARLLPFSLGCSFSNETAYVSANPTINEINS